MATEVRPCAPCPAPVRPADSPSLPQDLVAQRAAALEEHNNNSVLFKLPVELLENVLDLAYFHIGPDTLPHRSSPTAVVSGQPAHLPICQRLWPHQQRVRYRHIQLSSLAALYCLGELVTADARKPKDPHQPRLGSLILHLRLNMHNRYRAVDASDRARAPACLAQLFGSLDNLRSLRLSENGSNAVEPALDVVLHDPSTPAKLSALKMLSLSVRGRTIDAGDPDDPAAWLGQLGQFGSLDTLELDFDYNYGSDDALSHKYRPPSVIADATSRARPVVGNVSSLTVTAAFEFWAAPLRDLMPNLERLKVVDCDASGVTVIESAPSRLVSLDVEIDSYPSSDVVEALLQLLPAFPQLHRLRLRAYGHVVSHTSSPFHVLPDLEVLELDGRLGLADPVLLSIVDGPRRLQHLRKVSLSGCFVGAVGPTLESKGWVLPGPDEQDVLGLWQGWTPSKWLEGSSSAGHAVAVERGRARGVTFGGTIVEALEWRHEFNEEVRRVSLARGAQLGDWALAREVFTDEAVDSFIRQAASARAGR